MTRERLVWLLALLALAGGAWWLSANTEWVETDVPRAAQGEARDNPVYAFEQMLRRLGMSVAHHEALGTMPPPRARLVLLSSDWALIPDRAGQLHQWVLRGGHLVLVQGADWEDTALAEWVPVDGVDVKAAGQARPPARDLGAAALGRTELASSPPLWGDTERIAACFAFSPERSLRLKPGHAATWTLTRVDGTASTRAVVALQDQALRALQAKPAPPVKPTPQTLRVSVGQGSVTVLNAGAGLFHNDPALRCDNPLLLAAAVQAEPGATAWVYLHEKREALLPWLWQRGWIAIVAGLLALAAALWRGAVRFGLRLAPAPRLRRSISEQVRGLAAYLQRGGREALLGAQQRALDEVAARRLVRYSRLPLPERARAVAAATGLAADALSRAMSAKFCTRAELAQYLPLLETARRRLQETPEERHSP